MVASGMATWRGDMSTNSTEIRALTLEEVEVVSGGNRISMEVIDRNKVRAATGQIVNYQSVAQLDSPYETNDNLPT